MDDVHRASAIDPNLRVTRSIDTDIENTVMHILANAEDVRQCDRSVACHNPPKEEILALQYKLASTRH